MWSPAAQAAPFRVLRLVVMAVAALTAGFACADAGKAVIGATADFEEESSGIRFTARIDTGATTCSIHAEGIRVEGGASDNMKKNVGKKVSFELIDADGKRKRVESKIVSTVRVKTSEEMERRYKVWLTLQHDGVSRRVHVTLNDRSKMEYPLLIGRNFLCGQFLVDVSEEHTPLGGGTSESETAATEEGAESKDG